MTDAEFIQLQEEAAPVIRAVIQVAYLTGMRRGDLLDLRTTDLEDAGIRNRQNKTSKKQYFNWSPSLRAAVNLALSARVTPKVRKINEPKWLFTNRKGQQVTRTGFNSAWRRLRDKCSIEDLHFHDIRGKAATDAKRKGGIEYAQSLLGHDNISQTESYIQSKSTESVEPVK
jgi:integrase